VTRTLKRLPLNDEVAELRPHASLPPGQWSAPFAVRSCPDSIRSLSFPSPPVENDLGVRPVLSAKILVERHLIRPDDEQPRSVGCQTHVSRQRRIMALWRGSPNGPRSGIMWVETV